MFGPVILGIIIIRIQTEELADKPVCKLGLPRTNSHFSGIGKRISIGGADTVHIWIRPVLCSSTGK